MPQAAVATVHANAVVAAGFWARSGAAYYHTAKGGYAPTLVPGFGDMTTSLSAGTAACGCMPLRMTCASRLTVGQAGARTRQRGQRRCVWTDEATARTARSSAEGTLTSVVP